MLHVGDVAVFRKTVSESDVYQFAGITGDLHPNHVDEIAMAQSPYGQRIAHGALILGMTSTASTQMSQRANRAAVSYGYDRVRFTGAVLFGDTVNVAYTVTSIDIDSSKVYSDVTVHNQHGDLVLVATHILYFPEGLA